MTRSLGHASSRPMFSSLKKGLEDVFKVKDINPIVITEQMLLNV